MSFGKRLKFLRRREGLPVGKIAERVGLPKELLRDMEAGRRAPTRDVIHTLAAYFDVKPSYFEPRERRPPQRPEPPARRPRAAASGRWRKRRARTLDLSADDFAYFREQAPEPQRCPAPPPSTPLHREAHAPHTTAAADATRAPAPDLKSARMDAVDAQRSPSSPPSESGLPQTNECAPEFLTDVTADQPVRIPLPQTAAHPRPQPPRDAPPTLVDLLDAADTKALLCTLLEVLVRRGLCSQEELARTLRHYIRRS